AERARRANFVYGSSKAGLDAFCQGLGDSLVGSGARVVVVRPGFVHTKMTAGRKPAPLSTTPDAVADAVVRGLEKGAETIWAPPLARAAALGGEHRDMAKAGVLRRVLAGVPLAELSEAAESYADHVVARGLRPDVRARVDWHRAEGHELVLVSASPELYVAPIGRRLGFDAVLATRLELTADGRLTGRLLGANCRGPEKVARLRQWRGDALALAYAYGDSSGDTEMLTLAATAVKLARRRSLRLPE